MAFNRIEEGTIKFMTTRNEYMFQKEEVEIMKIQNKIIWLTLKNEIINDCKKKIIKEWTSINELSG